MAGDRQPDRARRQLVGGGLLASLLDVGVDVGGEVDQVADRERDARRQLVEARGHDQLPLAVAVLAVLLVDDVAVVGDAVDPVRGAAAVGEAIRVGPGRGDHAVGDLGHLEVAEAAELGLLGGRAEAVWADATTGEELRRRLRRLPGYGPEKVMIFVALLGKLAEK